jgi:phosphatidylserine/phosphatidylglycerophosphate/cardiolipin synthase-like enzyme
MRRRVESGGLTVQAIAGTHAVFLAFDVAPELRADLLGFSIYREDPRENERYWLSGFKTFRSVVPFPDPATKYSTRDHPLQTFQWGDYSAKPGYEYIYRVVPRFGTPKNLEDRPNADVSVEMTTTDPERGKHGVYFNRGVAASQAYATRFHVPPDDLPQDRRAEALTWLSRGLMERILAFIGKANAGDFALRAAVYEFTQPDVLAAFAQARQMGADVKILFHADGDPAPASRQAIADAGIDDLMLERHTTAIAHNKFIVLCEKNAGGLVPRAVWTGSTNFTQGAIFGHSNVGHEVRDADVAARYLMLWDRLAGNPTSDELRDWVSDNDPFPPPAADGVSTAFSPRHGLDALRWYAESFRTVDDVATITCAFGLPAEFEGALVAAQPAVRYILLEVVDNNQEVWSADRSVFVAVGSAGGPDVLTRWAAEELTGYNPMVKFIHTKFMLLDPLGIHPTVVTGSANFSQPSTSSNDENMLVIQDDLRVTDIYLTEFARMFNHMYARYWARRLQETDPDPDAHSFLAETPDWQGPYFEEGNPKQLQRLLFATTVEGNS